MGLVISVPHRHAQKLHRYLRVRDALDGSRKTWRDERAVYFPVRKPVEGLEVFSASLVRRRAQKAERKAVSLTELLSDGGKFRKSFEVVGSIIILELDRRLVPRQEEIARYLLKAHPAAATVVKKAGGHAGRFRLQRYVHLAGKRTFETIHVESGCRFELDIRKTYFSPRSASERLRIARLVRPGEDVLVMFSGIAPFPIVISRHSKARSIVGVELNPAAHEYGMRNVARNKCRNVTLIRGDVTKVTPRRKFDRIIMPLPKTAGAFLPLAFSRVRAGGMLHLYEFTAPEAIDSLKKKVEAAAAGRPLAIVRFVKAGQQAPRVFRMCADIRVR